MSFLIKLWPNLSVFWQNVLFHIWTPQATLILTIFINFSDFLTFLCYIKLVTSHIINYVGTFYFQPTLRWFNNCIKLYYISLLVILLVISVITLVYLEIWRRRGEGGGRSNWAPPPPEKTTLKKPSLIRVKQWV